ncbi:MAG TPA: A/G-specific adenine glycosylase [Bacteroidetes bacterium]|nr:A/G-specific adenine glycosylase [Bacteroidota bacterium]
MRGSIPGDRKSRITRAILRWYRKNGRALPWRNKRDPYRVIVSEVMLQQTQVSRVNVKYPIFLRRFPTLKSLAHAKTSNVIRAWRGMGYNSRALRLQQLARAVLDQHGGRMPREIDRLRALPGVGPYTSHAVACFAFHEQVPVVDTNVFRVFSRLFPKLLEKASTPQERVKGAWEIGARMLPRGLAFEWNQALMDLGASICTAASPRCERCPVNRHCGSAFAVKRRARSKAKSEPARDGVPNRVYRGRVVEALRNLDANRSIPFPTLGRMLKPNFSRRDKAWLTKLLTDLERDGLIATRSSRTAIQISMPES